MKQLFIISILGALVGCNSDVTEKKAKESMEESVVIHSTTPYEKAYEKALSLWKVPVERKLIQTSYGEAHVIACGPKNERFFTRAAC